LLGEEGEGDNPRMSWRKAGKSVVIRPINRGIVPKKGSEEREKGRKFEEPKEKPVHAKRPKF